MVQVLIQVIVQQYRSQRYLRSHASDMRVSSEGGPRLRIGYLELEVDISTSVAVMEASALV
jgi:hypothetical protein